MYIWLHDNWINNKFKSVCLKLHKILSLIHFSNPWTIIEKMVFRLRTPRNHFTCIKYSFKYSNIDLANRNLRNSLLPCHINILFCITLYIITLYWLKCKALETFPEKFQNFTYFKYFACTLESLKANKFHSVFHFTSAWYTLNMYANIWRLYIIIYGRQRAWSGEYISKGYIRYKVLSL